MMQSIASPMRFAAIFAVLLCAVLLASGCESKDQQAVAAADDAVDAALDSRNGKAAAELISKSSLEWLDRIVDLAKTASKDKVRALPYSDKLEVLRIRHRAPAADIRKLADGRAYYAYAVSNGWITSSSSEGTKRGRIRVLNGKSARVQFIDADGEKYDSAYVLEDGVWKEDITSRHSAANRDMKRSANAERVSEDEIVVEVLQAETNKDVKPSVWDPPN